MAGTKSATAKMTISGADGLVSASIGLDLLKDPTVATTVTVDNWDYASVAVDFDDYYDSVLVSDGISIYYPGYLDYLKLKDIVTFANGLFDDEDSAEATIFEALDVSNFVTAVNAAVTGTIIRLDDDDTDNMTLEVYTAIASNDADGVDTAADPPEFEFEDLIASQMAAAYTAAVNEVEALVDEAISQIMNLTTTTTTVNGYFIYNIDTAAELITFITDLDPADVDTLVAADIDFLTEALDYYVAYLDATNDPDFGVSATTTLTAASFISSASFKLMKMFGVLDMTGNMSGQNVAVGMISLDGKGHTSTTVKSFPSLALSLSSGVISGVTAGVTLYSDDNADANAVDAITDKWYTWIDETAAKVETVEPKLGLKIDGGYSMTVSDMTIGASLAVGLFDFLGDSTAFGLSIKPSFSGFGATVGVEFDYGLDMMYIGANVGYSIMGIKPSVSFAMANLSGDNVIAFVTDDLWTSAKAAVLDTGGMLLGVGASIDISQLAPITGSVSGGLDIGMPTDLDMILGWNASLSVTPVSFLTIAGGASDAGIYKGDYGDDKPAGLLAYNAKATVALGTLVPAVPLTITGGISSAYNSDKEAGFLTWNAGVSMKHSIATVTFDLSNAYDKDADAAYMKYSFGTSMSF
jgi:hypothetical protein